MANSKLKSALQYHKGGDLEKAKEIYEEILADEPDAVEVLHLLSILFSQEQNFNLALEYMQRALKKDPGNALLHSNAGNILSNLQRLNEAKAQYQKAIEIEPNSASIHNNLANLLSKQQQNVEALEHYQTAIRLKPDYADAYYNLGFLLAKNNADDDAIEKFLTVLKLEPDHLKAHRQLAYLYSKREQFGKAIEHYEACLKIDESDLTSQQNLGAILAKIGDFAAALPYLQKALPRQPEHIETLYNLGTIFLQQKKLDLALQYFLQILAIKPDFDTYYNIGASYMDQNRYSEALSYFAEALAIDPDSFAVHYNLAVIYLKLEEYPKAIENFKTALQIDSGNEEISYLLEALENAAEKKPGISAAPKEYLQHLFDQYAPHFDVHLTKFLQYKAPELLYKTIADLAAKDEMARWVVLDLGCGTGLTGEKYKGMVKTLIGVDLSAGMLEVARGKNIYDELHQLDIVEALAKYDHSIDLVIAADTFVYSGNLELVFQQAGMALKPGGYFAFTCEEAENYPYQLQKSARFAHAKAYIIDLADKYDFEIVNSQKIILRAQKGTQVFGVLYVLKH